MGAKNPPDIAFYGQLHIAFVRKSESKTSLSITPKMPGIKSRGKDRKKIANKKATYIQTIRSRVGGLFLGHCFELVHDL